LLSRNAKHGRTNRLPGRIAPAARRLEAPALRFARTPPSALALPGRADGSRRRLKDLHFFLGEDAASGYLFMGLQGPLQAAPAVPLRRDFDSQPATGARPGASFQSVLTLDPMFGAATFRAAADCTAPIASDWTFDA
jgi:hypothetical protein